MVTKSKVVGFVAALITAIVVGGGLADAQLPLSALAGNWAGEGNANFALCFNKKFTKVVDCSKGKNAVYFTQTAVLQSTLDAQGNSCATVFVTNSPEFPIPGGATFSATFVQAVTITSYNPTPESGQTSFTTYLAGQGTFCNGSVLVNTANEPESGHGTGSFVVSQNGSRLDGVINTSVNSPVSDLEDYVGHVVVLKQ